MHPGRRFAAAIRALATAWSTAIDDEIQRSFLPGVRFGSGVLLRGADRISAGTGVFLDHRAYLSCGTINERRGYIRLGNRVEIGPYSVLWGGGGIEIGDDVHLGAHVHVTSQQGRPYGRGQSDGDPLAVDCAPVRIGDHTLIYSGAIVVPGVTIGHHAVVAAGAVVAEDVPPYALVAGVPARVVRTGAPA
ncbi:MAG TPA: DapH/DapD/GlmU-related protein [Candidatus Acidoferrales bacterium]|nr:DapH/DapD/GlmU-related protein [Candidatus Acidoferrales bacterium]